MKDRKITTCSRLDLKTLGSRPIMPKTLPGHSCKTNLDIKAPELGNQSLSAKKNHKNDDGKDYFRMSLTSLLHLPTGIERMTTCEASSSIRAELQELRKVSQPWNHRGNRVEGMNGGCIEHTYISYTTRDWMQSPCSMERSRSSGNSGSHGMIEATGGMH